MHKNIRIPVQIRKVKDPDGRETLRARPMNLMFEKNFSADWFEEELTRFERRYFYLVTCLKSLSEFIHSKKKENRRVLLYWEFGNKIVEFAEQNKKGPLYIESLTKSLVRDVGVSKKTIARCKRFRLLYPDVAKVNPNRSFNSYIVTFEGGYISTKRRNKKMRNHER